MSGPPRRLARPGARSTAVLPGAPAAASFSPRLAGPFVGTRDLGGGHPGRHQPPAAREVAAPLDCQMTAHPDRMTAPPADRCPRVAGRAPAATIAGSRPTDHAGHREEPHR